MSGAGKPDPMVMVCVTGQKSCERLIRYGAFLGAQLRAGVVVVHVAKPGAPLMGEASEEGKALTFLYEVAAENGASLTILRSKRTLEALETYAKKNNAVAVVTGSAAPGLGGDFIQALRKRIATADVHALPYE